MEFNKLKWVLKVAQILNLTFLLLIRYGIVRDSYHNVQGYRKWYKVIGLENWENIYTEEGCKYYFNQFE